MKNIKISMEVNLIENRKSIDMNNREFHHVHEMNGIAESDKT